MRIPKYSLLYIYLCEKTCPELCAVFRNVSLAWSATGYFRQLCYTSTHHCSLTKDLSKSTIIFLSLLTQASQLLWVFQYNNIMVHLLLLWRPCHSSGGWSPASHRGGPDSNTGQVMWDLWWTKWYLSRFSPRTSVSPTNSHSTDCCTFIIIIIIYHPRLIQ
jgi:hypothetical protein